MEGRFKVGDNVIFKINGYSFDNEHKGLENKKGTILNRLDSGLYEVAFDDRITRVISGCLEKIKKQPQKAMRFNTGKAEFFDAPVLALAEVAKVAAYGRSKYDTYNWKKGGPASQYHDCRQRHEIKYWYGQDKDSESKCFHLAHIAWNALAALELQLTGNLDDNRYKGYSEEFVNNLENLFMLDIEQKQAIQEQLDKKAKNVK